MCYAILMKTQEVRARIDPATKSAAENIFYKLGMTPSEAIRLFYYQVSLHDGLPFEVRVPNAMTERALKDTLSGKNLSDAQTLEEFTALLSDVE